MGGFSSPVALAASGLPPGATLNFNPMTVTPSGVAISGTTMTTASLEIVTAPNQTYMIPFGHHFPSEGSSLQYGFLFLPLPLLGMIRLRKQLGKFPRTIVVLVLAILSLGAITVGVTACANIGLQLQQQNYTVTVTGTSGNLTHSTNLTLGINNYVPIKY